jgi:hypothetical protein
VNRMDGRETLIWLLRGAVVLYVHLTDMPIIVFLHRIIRVSGILRDNAIIAIIVSGI